MSERTDKVRAKPVEGPRPKLTARAAVLIVAVMLLALLGVSPVRAYLNQRTQFAELEHQAQVLEDTNAKLRSEITNLHDPAELDRLARECLGLVESGQVALVKAPKGAATPPAAEPGSAGC